jgi:hypothetical protein
MQALKVSNGNNYQEVHQAFDNFALVIASGASRQGDRLWSKV